MFWFLMLAWFPPQEIVAEDLNITTYQDRFTEALDKFNSVDRIDSRDMFENLVAELEDESPLTMDQRLLLTESLKYLGILTFPRETESFFAKIIEINPSYQMSSRDVPPKIVAVYDGLRSQKVGTLKVQAFDSNDGQLLEESMLYVDGKFVGLIQGATTFGLLAGTREVEIRRENFINTKDTLTIVAGTELPLSRSLRREKAEMMVVTVPAGVEVLINGEVRGTTDQPVPNFYTSRLREIGASNTEAGALSIDGLELGRYDLSFRKPCFQEVTKFIEVDKISKFPVLPMRMEAAGASLTVTSPGSATGIAFLNSERLGFLPLQNKNICPGEYVLRVQFSDGEFVKRLRVKENESVTLSAEPLPTIAWFGVLEGDEDAPSDNVNQWLEQLKSWNVLAVNPNDTRQVPVNPYAALFEEKEMTSNGELGLTRNLKADLFMAARVVRRKVVIRYLEVAFWSPLSRKIHIAAFDFRELDKFQTLLAEMDKFPPVTHSWLGILVAKMSGLEGCQVIAVSDKGPLAGKVQVGQTITMLNNKPFENPQLLRTLPLGQSVSMTVDGATINLNPTAAIAEVPFDASSMVPQAFLAKFEKLSKYHSDELVRDSAKFNIARFQMFLGDFKSAFDVFSTMQLNQPFGINQGTLFFYQGLCFRRLNLNGEAANAFQSVLKYPDATLFDAYGPSAAFWAQSELKNAGP